MPDDEAPITLPLVYIGAEEVPTLYANQFVIQYDRGDFILLMGQVSPPILLGSDEEQRAQAKQVGYVPVKVVGRYAMSRDRVAELVQLLATSLNRVDAARGQAAPDEPTEGAP